MSFHAIVSHRIKFSWEDLNRKNGWSKARCFVEIISHEIFINIPQYWIRFSRKRRYEEAPFRSFGVEATMKENDPERPISWLSVIIKPNRFSVEWNDIGNCGESCVPGTQWAHNVSFENNTPSSIDAHARWKQVETIGISSPSGKALVIFTHVSPFVSIRFVGSKGEGRVIGLGGKRVVSRIFSNGAIEVWNENSDEPPREFRASRPWKTFPSKQAA